MTIELTRAQLRAFLSLVLAVVILGIVPVVITAVSGVDLPSSMVAVLDKASTGLIGVLGTLVGIMWQSRQKPVPEGPSGNPGDPVSVTPEDPK